MENTSSKYMFSNKWLLFALIPCLILAGGGGWLAASNSGLEWLVRMVERQSKGRFSANGISGSLLDSPGIQKIVLQGDGDGWRISLQDAQLQWQPAAMLRGELKVMHLNVREVEIISSPSDTLPVLPDKLSLPLNVSVLNMKIDSLHILNHEGAEPDFVANDVEAQLMSDVRHHQIKALHARLAYGDFAGEGEIASEKPYALKVQASLDAVMQLSGKPEHTHFDAKVGGNLQHIDVKLDGNGAGMSVNGTAQLAPFAAVPVSRLQIAFSGMEVARLFKGTPNANLSGNIKLHGISGGELDGTLQIRNTNAAPLNQNGIPVRDVTAMVRLSTSHIQLQQLDARLPSSGHISGSASWTDEQGKLHALLSVHELDAATLDTRLTSTHLHGDITLEGVGENQHALVVLSDAKLNFHGELERQGDQVELSSVRLTHGKTELVGHGQLALDRRRSFRFFSQLHNLNLSDFAATPQTDINAGLEVSGTLLPEIKGTLLFKLSDSHYAKQGISGNGRLEFVGVQRVAAVDVRLGVNRLDLNVAYGNNTDRVQVVLDAPDLGQLGTTGLSGQLAGRADISGSLANPRLQFSTLGQNLTLPGNQHFAELDATGDLSSDAMQAKLSVKGYHGRGALNMPEASVELLGNRVQHSVHVSASFAQDEDTLGELTLEASGGLSDPAQGWKALQWDGKLDQLTSLGVLPFHMTTTTQLKFGRESLEIGAADVAIGGGKVQFYDTQWTPKSWHSSGSFSGINVRAVNLQQYKSVSDILDFMRFGGTWEVTANEHLQGQLQVKRESGDWVVDSSTGLRLGLRDLQLSIRAEQDQLFAQLDASGELLGEMAMQANLPLSRTETGWTILPDTPLAGQLHLHSDDLSWLGPVLDSNLQSGGQLKFDAEVEGTILSPRLQGEMHGDELSFGLLDQGIRLEQGELGARFESDVVHVDRLVFKAPLLPLPRDKLLAEYNLAAGTGELSASGRIDLDGGSGELQITAQRLPLAQRADRWIIASGTGHARYAGKALMLDGTIRADAGLINQPVSDRPRWSEDVHIIGQEPIRRVGPPTAVDATLDLGDHFYIRASGLEGRLAGQLNVRGEPGEPLLVTGIIAAQNAMFDAYGQHLEVERGWVNFQGPLDDPGLNILAIRKGLSVEAGVEVTGTVRRPTVRLVSIPNVPDGEKLSWIILGRVPESSGVDSALLLAAAGSILGGQSAGKFGNAFGVDEISLSQQEGVDAQQIQKVTVGKRLSSRARISYEQSLNEVGGVTKFTYTLTPRITVVTRTGTEDALDLFYSFRFY